MATSRRISFNPPRIVGRVPNDYAQELQEFLEMLARGQDDGIPPGFNDTTPQTVIAGGAASAGTETTGWMASDAQLVADTDTPVAVGVGNTEGASGAFARADHQHDASTLFYLSLVM